jgi:electron transport complex protein RnfE
MGAVRELLGNGTVFDITVTPPGFQPALLVILAPGGFIALGIFMALFRAYRSWSAERRGAVALPVHDEGCAACGEAAFCSAFKKRAEGGTAAISGATGLAGEGGAR